ncbi:MAG: hypothetical protein IKN56_06640 [Clostridia bacterium]|nr:hypothetical protein [Clostridia bacterium]
MSKKSIGGICAIIAMASVVIYFIWGMIAHSYQNAWIVFMIAGVAMASVSIIAGMKKEKEEETDKKEKLVKEEENSPEE